MSKQIFRIQRQLVPRAPLASNVSASKDHSRPRDIRLWIHELGDQPLNTRVVAHFYPSSETALASPSKAANSTSSIVCPSYDPARHWKRPSYSTTIAKPSSSLVKGTCRTGITSSSTRNTRTYRTASRVYHTRTAIQISPNSPRSTAAIRSLGSTSRTGFRMSSSTSKVEEAKALAAVKAVADHFSPDFKFVGIGSGTTIVYVINEIKRVLGADVSKQLFVPTGYQSRQAIVSAGLTPVAFDTLPDDVILDVAFDGADEVDEELNCIKGGGACLFQEKLVAERARKFVCVADYRKLQPRLLTNWPTIPIEVAPIASQAVLHALSVLGSQNAKVRSGLLAKAGPLKTDQDFFIIDAPFPQPLLIKSDIGSKGKGDGSDGSWGVDNLSKAIKAITGVLEVGIFAGRDGVDAFSEGASKGTAHGGQKPVAVYFGMQDGSVEVRNRK